MFEQQNAVELQENPGFGNPMPCLFDEINSGTGRNLDRDWKARRGTYTKTPSREVLSRKGRNAVQSPNKKKRNRGDKEDNKDRYMIGSFPLRGMVSGKEDELLHLRGQLDEL
ncbi:hypothetical protein SAY86_002875 [Trapa natans]|uniref:Uncharacterized protein n=1 Tax=Trapa natans TaxID=22666 RepID=A0AAN7LUL9_TRANT|nr:hypothetical protein SAY86_002875 [Trapa natans]